MSAELGNYITFFKDDPSSLREWPPQPDGYGPDRKNDGCLNYKQMNNNFNTLEGRDIGDVYYDSDCVLHIKTLSGRDFSTNVPCSNGGTLSKDLDFSGMFKENGCCPDQHFGWLASWDSSLGEGYNKIKDNIFPAGTSFESILRTILEGDAGPVVVNYTFVGSKTFDYSSSGFYTDTINIVSGSCSGTCDISLEYNGTNGFNNKQFQFIIQKEDDPDLTGEYTYTSSDYGTLTISNISGIQSCSEESTNITIKLILTVHAQAVGPITAKYAYDMIALETIGCDWEDVRVISTLSKENTLPSNIPQVSIENTEASAYDEFINNHDYNPYYFFARITNEEDFGGDDDPERKRVSVLRLPKNLNAWNYCLLIYSTTGGEGEWVKAELQQHTFDDAPTCSDNDYDYYYFCDMHGVTDEPQWLSINIS